MAITTSHQPKTVNIDSPSSKRMKERSPCSAKPPPCFYEQIIKRKWKSVIHLLSEEEGKQLVEEYGTIGPTNVVTGETLLHQVCKYQPPENVVEKIIRLFPQAVSQKDHMERTPLHTAAANGAQPKVVKLLVSINPRCAGTQDCDGKTPLILLCENCCNVGGCNSLGMFDTGVRDASAVSAPLMEVVEALFCACPPSIHIEDDEGGTAIEYAILNGASRPVVRRMQKLSEEAWKHGHHPTLEEERQRGPPAKSSSAPMVMEQQHRKSWKKPALKKKLSGVGGAARIALQTLTHPLERRAKTSHAA